MEPERRLRGQTMGRRRRIRSAPALAIMGWQQSVKSRRSGGRASRSKKTVSLLSGRGFPFVAQRSRSGANFGLRLGQLVGGESRHLAWAVPYNDAAVQLLVNGHCASGQRVAPLRLRNLENAVEQCDRVV